MDTYYAHRKSTLTLKNGRLLGYDECGDPAGKPAFYFHGLPGSTVEMAHLEGAANSQGVRLIGIDRPGFGSSDFKADRTILDFPDDVVELADHLGISNFGVSGMSAGGVYALACAAKIPERITCCAVISGAGDKGLHARMLGRFMPFIMMPMMARMFSDRESSEKLLIEKMSSNMPDADQRALAKGNTAKIMAASLVEGFAQGGKGAALDGKLISGNYGFAYGQIELENIFLWHGEADKQIPIAVALRTAEALLHCQATFYPGEGHISVIVNHADEIVDALA